MAYFIVSIGTMLFTATPVNEGTAALDAVDGGVLDLVQVWLDWASAHE